ncbi:hypothetical protein ACFPJ4_02290 [Lysinimonas soli]|uniref:Di-and tripeptidase n=1 Tax=Lysinimonas soli TaxID=1074233 RepID=A0ABW0NMU3_9MICO
MAEQIATSTSDGLHPRVAQGIDKVLSVQRPVVLAHLRSIRSSRPDASPAQVVAILERRFLTAVTSGGALVGASAAIPAVGVGTSLMLSGVETAGFLEASALFAQSVTEIHGIAVVEPERARTLVMALMLGTGGQELLQQFAAEAGGRGSRSAYWGEFITKSLPRAAFGQVADRVRSAFLKRFAVTQGTSIIGRAIPFGIGAVVGGTGNHLLGRRIIRSARGAFGPAPELFPEALGVVVRVPKAPRALRRRIDPPPPDAADRRPA